MGIDLASVASPVAIQVCVAVPVTASPLLLLTAGAPVLLLAAHCESSEVSISKDSMKSKHINFKRVAMMINQLEPGDLRALKRAVREASKITQMDYQALFQVTARFQGCTTPTFRNSRGTITALGEYGRICLEAVDWSRILVWFDAWNQGIASPEWMFFEFWVNQPLADGNKRIGMVLTYAYCQRHGLPLPNFPVHRTHEIKVALFAIHYGDQPVEALHELIF